MFDFVTSTVLFFIGFFFPLFPWRFGLVVGGRCAQCFIHDCYGKGHSHLGFGFRGVFSFFLLVYVYVVVLFGLA